jgi:AcrR family transcriptional regulator
MKVSELSRETGIATSAIHYYLQLGILHRPNKVGLNLHLYDETHLTRLRQIRELKEEKGLSPAEIRRFLEKSELRARSRSVTDTKVEGLHPLETSIRGGEESRERDERENREKILDMAIKLFSEKGYENTKVSDITEALRMGKGTFYVYFKNKRELFMECIDRLAVTMVPRDAWDEIRSEQDFRRKNRKRGMAFLEAFPGYRGILNMVRGAIGGSDPLLAQKAIEAFRVLSRPMLKDLRTAISDDGVRIKHDEAFIAYMLLVLAESFGYWQMIDPRYSVEEGIEIIGDILENGLIHTSPFRHRPVDRQGPSGEVEDSTGRKTRLRDISLEGEHALRGRMGDAEVEVDLAKLAAARFNHKGGRLQVELTTDEGQHLELEMNGDVHLSGLAPYGSIRVPLKRILSVSFGES